MLRITDPTLKRMLLDQIVARIDAGGIDDLLQAGFSPEFLDCMRHRPARDLIKASEVPAIEFRVTIKERAITEYFARLDMMRRDAQMCEYFIRHGAAVQVVCMLWKISAEEVRSLRAQLLPPDQPLGRNRMPAPAVRDQIHARWAELEADDPRGSLRDRLYRLHQSFPDCRIDSLCRTIDEFSAEPSWPVTDFGTLS